MDGFSRRARALALPALAGLLLACGGAGHGAVQASTAGTYATDTQCQVGLLFLRDYDRVNGSLGSQVDAAREALNGARDEATSEVALQKLASALDGYDAALAALEAPSDDAAEMASAISSGGRLAEVARLLARQPGGSRDLAAFEAAVQARGAATRALSLRIQLLRSECA